jgi:hypothetical protein
MKKVSLLIALAAFAGIAMFITLHGGAPAGAHGPGEDETSIALGKGKVTIQYGTPKLGSRNLDEMIKPGLPWFMGMNKPTTLETTVALDFNGKRLEPGKYAIFSRADEMKNWTLLVSSAVARPLKLETVVLEAPLQFTRDAASQDMLKITLEKAGEGASLVVAWGAYRLQGAFKAASS